MLFVQMLCLINIISRLTRHCAQMKKQPSPQTYILHGYWCSEFHGTGGPLRIEHHSPSPLSHKLVEAGRSLEYPPSNDYNTGSTQGKLFYNVHYIIRILLVTVCGRVNCSRKKKQQHFLRVIFNILHLFL